MALAIEISGLRKMYKGAWSPALDGLSLQVKKNQIMGLLGPNGAGKTTCINILCGLVKPDEGEALVFGHNVTKNIEQIRRQIGVVPQQIALFGNMTAWENFKYIGRLYNLSELQIKERAAGLLERLGLMAHADKRVARYSGGMKRRTNIIASLLHEPELIILDEPTAGVDVQSRALIHDFLVEYHQKGKTILYTSHHLDEAEQLCDDVVIVDEGKFIISGSPRQLIAQTAAHSNCSKLEDVFLHYTGHTVRD
ncbi:MAG TPA: ABC transporter ATP-binding protein [Flavipsychrobacter sp.]|jgi:ABC-2 type transport system ATP-binding protein|nr:ABC transporter ATP-binding protein [Flavipsychrobacter sp.]